MLTKKPHYFRIEGEAGKYEEKKNASTQQQANTGGGKAPETVKPETVVNGNGGTGYDPVKYAQDMINQHQAKMPGAWVDPFKNQYMGYLDQYMNREPFSYDYNADALYQQYKDQYIQQGQLASMDTMGKAAAMTGGYGNSYAQSVGQQAFNQYLGQLNAVMPELYGMAYDKYNQEGQDLLSKYSLYKGLSEESYGKHQDAMDSWYKEYSQLADNYNALTKEPEYNELLAGSDAYGYIDKEIRGATSVEGLKAVLKKYASMKYDPDVLEQMAAEKLKELS